jgi:hypothetical protein
MAFDLDEELRTAIAAASSLYGTRDESFELLPVAYHEKNYAQSVVDDRAMTISVKLANPAPFSDRDSEAKFELWHEAVHCLVPVNRMDTLWFEEGVAIRFGLKHAPLSAAKRRANRAVIKPPWKLVQNAFAKLDPTDAQIAAIRERADRRLFDTVTKELIIEVCGARPKLALELCQRLSPNTR